ncbi:MAG: ATP-binding protein, partial [Phycisphaerae bacterium]
KRIEQALGEQTVALRGANLALKEAGAAAEAATQAKSAFLANMSHEIRTPMTAILGFTETLLEPGLSEAERTKAINIIHGNGEHLLAVINDILDISKIEAGKLEIETISCSPIQIIADVCSLMRVRADEKGLPLRVEYDGAIPETIQTDPTRLKQILVNLLGNAIKFTDKGEVRLVARCDCSATVAGRWADSPMMAFDIIDSGIGMTPEQKAKLFDAFTQADSSMTRRYGGTGLGLTISKRLAEMLGGDIAIESEPGRGSTFHLMIAAGSLDGVKMIEDPSSASAVNSEGAVGAGPGGAEQAKAGGAPKLDCRVLLAEDGPDNQRLIAYILKKAGARVTIKENGRLALDAALAASDEGSPFDVILMDMQMPVMDGYEATRRLRESGYAGPIIALTAHAMSGDRDKCLAAGCDDYARKPIDRKTLIETIRNHVNKDKIAGRHRNTDQVSCRSS